MSTQIQRRRGTTTQHSTFTGAAGELTVDTDKEVVVVHDGVQVGGYPLMRENGSNSALALGSAGTPSLKFTGDPNTGIYSPGADQVAISTNGTGRLFVDASGRIGIGSAANANNQVLIRRDSPSAIADVLLLSNGQASNLTGQGVRINFSGAAEASASSRYSYIESATSSGNNEHYLAFGTNAAFSAPVERMRLDSSGRLGLGTSSPSSSLHIVGTGVISAATGTGGVLYQARNSDVSALGYFGIEGNTAGATLTGTLANATLLSSGAAGTALQLGTGGAIRATLTSTGLGIGTAAPSQLLHLNSATAVNTYTLYQNPNTQTYLGVTAAGDTAIYNDTANRSIVFSTNGTERGRWDPSGRFLVGTSSARSNVASQTPFAQIELATNSYTGLSVINNSSSSYEPSLYLGLSNGSAIGSNTSVSSGNALGAVKFVGNDGTNFLQAASISAWVDGTPGANDMPGRIVFSTTADGASSPTERMRISNQGNVFFDGNTALPSASVAGLAFTPASNGRRVIYTSSSTTAYQQLVLFYNPNGLVGSIATDGSATSYNTSSDYRLKENVVPLTGAIARVNQLQVHRFNFIADPDKTVDGFIAHEAQAIVPESVTGTKDEVDADGNPVYQGIDQSKLVPLLTAALQEAIAKIETLEAKVAALEAA